MAAIVPLASAVIAAAVTQLGVTYAWGKESPGKAFDCSGLVQWAYGTVGLSLPRTSQAQAQATTPISAGQALPGDLAFMAGSDGTPTSPGHVGIVLGGGRMIDAPYTGVDVRVDPIPAGATYGRVQGLSSDVTSPVSVNGTTALYTSAIGGGAAPGQNCGGGAGINLDPLSAIPVIGGLAPQTNLFNGCQLKAIVGGLCVGAGGFVLLVGTALIAAHALTSTKPGKTATKAAGTLGGVAGKVPGIGAAAEAAA